MSVEAAKRFCLQMGSDNQFLDDLLAASSVDEHFRIARDAGYDFTADEFETAVEQVLEADALDDLLDDDGEVLGYLASSFLQIQGVVRTKYIDGGIGAGSPRDPSLSFSTLHTGPCATFFRA